MKIRLFFWLGLLLGSAGLFQPAAAQTAPADGRQLRDIPVFAAEKNGQWAGSGQGMTLETIGEGGNASLPVDESERFNDLPSYRVNVAGENGWWSFILAGHDWESYSIAPYYANGALEFNVKGGAGEEDFQVSISDIEYGRDPLSLPSTKIPLSSLLTVSEEWQHVRIPLTALLPDPGGFNLDQMYTVDFASVNGSPMTFWLNDIKFTSPDPEPGFPPIKVNQLGYLPDAPKTAWVSGFADELQAQPGDKFEVRELLGNRVAYEGELALAAEEDPVVSGERILAADFSELTAPGDYYLALDTPRADRSPAFTIGDDVYGRLLTHAQHYFYLQRSGLALEAQYAGQFARGAGHLQDASAQFRSGALAPRNVAGGWYDAGDFGKYVNAGATAVSDLLWAYELFPNQFPDNQNNIPESGNGLPDLLDEVQWELDFILKMQDPESGGFYHMVQPTEDGTIPAARGTRYIEDVADGRENVRPTSTTGSAVAALAHAARIYAPFDAEYAAILQSAAESGWAYLAANPGGVAPVPGPYSDDDDSDDRFWAAAALYRLTGGAVYGDYVKAVYQDVPTFFTTETDNAYGVGLMGMVGWLNYAYSQNPDPEVMAYFADIFTGWSARMAERWQASPWKLTLLDEDFYWGSNYVTLTTPLVMLVGARALGLDDSTAVAISQDALNYLLGANPLRFSYVSGYGEDSLRNPFSQQWSNDGVPDVPPGILAGGPNAYNNSLLFSNFAGKRYVDSQAAWSTNEHTIYWNSALVFQAALAAQLAHPAGLAPAQPVGSVQATAVAELPPTAVPVVEEAAAGETAVAPLPSPPTEAPAQVSLSPALTVTLYALIALNVLLLLGIVGLVVYLRRILARLP
ncbi:MAG: glycoside hydrolase family 9 protein [Ardenticatenaceae bacterium]|nr:glycoside hydrolase family 9 protein [Ardenticatenaceae bacterium]MCB8987316.1 glycoside hydrolase family 9 protein [Ardenticatenaceae bacterium]